MTSETGLRRIFPQDMSQYSKSDQDGGSFDREYNVRQDIEFLVVAIQCFRPSPPLGNRRRLLRSSLLFPGRLRLLDVS